MTRVRRSPGGPVLLQTTRPCPVAFAGKLNHDGTALVYMTYLGASNSSGSGIALDGQGNAWIAGAGGDVYVAGSTDSPDFPVSTAAFQTDAGPKLAGPNAQSR